MNRPSDWYQMSYDEQRRWEEGERRHRRELRDAEDEAQAAADDSARRARRASLAAQEETTRARADRDEVSDELEQLRRRHSALVVAARALLERAGAAEHWTGDERAAAEALRKAAR